LFYEDEKDLLFRLLHLLPQLEFINENLVHGQRNKQTFVERFVVDHIIGNSDYVLTEDQENNETLLESIDIRRGDASMIAYGKWFLQQEVQRRIKEGIHDEKKKKVTSEKELHVCGCGCFHAHSDKFIQLDNLFSKLDLLESEKGLAIFGKGKLETDQTSSSVIVEEVVTEVSPSPRKAAKPKRQPNKPVIYDYTGSRDRFPLKKKVRRWKKPKRLEQQSQINLNAEDFSDIVDRFYRLDWFDAESEVVSLKGQVYAGETDENGDHRVLVQWTPIGIIEDELIPDGEFTGQKKVQWDDLDRQAKMNLRNHIIKDLQRTAIN